MLPPQWHASPCLEPQSRAPASFVGEDWDCHHPRAYYSSQLETCENTCGHVHLGQAASGCKGAPWGCRWEAWVSPYPQHVPLPPGFTLGLHLHMLWERERLESCCVPDGNYPGGLLPGSTESSPALGRASAGASTASLALCPPASHSTQVSLQG